MKKLLYIALAALALAACKPDTVRFDIPQLEDEMHIRASVERIQLRQVDAADTAVVFSWDIPALKDGITSYEYYFKMDISGNGFASSISPMLMDGGNSVAFTHRQINEMIENWKITAGTWAALDAEIIAVPQGLDHYVKPMISTITFEAMGYASILYLAGSATSVGTDYTKALAMSKVAGQDAYTWTGALDEGGFLFLVDRSDSTAVYGKASSEDALAYWETIAQAQSFSVARAGYYTLTASLADMSLVRVEPLFLFGSATEGGWSLPDATPMTNITGSTLTWSGILSAGELKFLCEPDPALRDFNGAFYMAANPDAIADSVSDMMFVKDGNPDQKWQVPSAGMYKIDVDLAQHKATFTRDADFDQLPYKQIWIWGDGSPAGWNYPFHEKFVYTPSEGRGIFVWTGELYANEGTEKAVKFPLYDGTNNSADAPFFMALEPWTQIEDGVEYAMQYVSKGTPDNKWVVTSPGKYKVTIDVLGLTVKFEKQ